MADARCAACGRPFTVYVRLLKDGRRVCSRACELAVRDKERVLK